MKHFIPITTVFFSLFLFNLGFSQEVDGQQNIKKTLKDNTDYIINEQYYNSLSSGKKLVEADANNANYNYRYGLALFYVSPLINEAEPYLKKASELTTDKYDMFKNSEVKAPNEAIFLYGVVLHRNNKIDEALNAYQNYLSKIDEKSSMYYEVKLKIKQANNAKSIQLNNNVKNIETLPKTINTENSDFAPIVSFDGSRLFFTSSRMWNDAKGDANTVDNTNGQPYEDIYMSDYSNDSWGESSILPFCTTTDNEASVSVSIDERRVYLYNSSKVSGDIFYSDFKDGNFGALKMLSFSKEFSKSWKPHYFVSSDGKLAFLSSDEPNGLGGLDLYMLRRQTDGSWSDPVNLGPDINTPYNEDAPFLSFDGKYLYYSSDNENSIGGYDIFRAEYKNGRFINSENLGLPINSTYDDSYYTITSDGMTAFMSSFRDGGIGGMDIYQINFNETTLENSVLKGRVFYANKEETIPENIEIRLVCDDCDDQMPIVLLPRLRDGKFMGNLEKCKNYSLNYIDNNRDNEIIATQKFNTNCDETYQEIRKELAIQVGDDGKIAPVMEYVMVGEIYDKEDAQRIGNVTIEIQDKKGKTLQSVTSDAEGKFESGAISGLKIGREYPFKMIVKYDGYITITRDTFVIANYERVIDLGEIGLEKNVVEKDLGKVIALNTIYYDLNSSYLRTDAKRELDKIVEALNNNKEMKIELRSHTDCRESTTYNDWLSERRANRASNYIMRRISNGSNRITGAGYGESQLVNECRCDVTDDSGCTEEQHQANRRTEFIIVSDLNKGQQSVK